MAPDKSKNVDEMLKMLEKAYSTPPSIIAYTEDYVYTLFPTTSGGDKWMEASIITPDGIIEKKELTSKDAIMYLIKEVVEGLGSYLPLPIVKDKDTYQQAISKVKGIK